MARRPAPDPTPQRPPQFESPPAPTTPAPPAASPAASRGRAVIVGRAAVLTIVFAVALEVTCRIDDWIRFGTPPFSRFISQGDLMVRDSLGAHGRPNSQFQKWRLNNLGMRGSDVSPRPVAGTVRLVTLGASETFGLYESDGREYPRQLEDSLRVAIARGCPAGSGARNVEVLNAALPGMSLPTVAQDVRLRVAAVEPDVVVLYATPSQFLEELPPVATRPDSTNRDVHLPWRRAVWPRSVGRIRDQVKQLLPSPVQTWMRQRHLDLARAGRPADWRFTEIPADRVAQYERDLRRAVGAIRAAGAVPVLATHTNAFVGVREYDEDKLYAWERFYPRASGRLIVAFDSAANAVTARVARDSGAVLADVPRAVSGATPGLFADFSHFTDAGAARMAGVITSALVGSADAPLCAAARTTAASAR